MLHALWPPRRDRHRDTVMAGRTHLQQALPTTFGLKCAVWALPFIGHLQRLDATAPARRTGGVRRRGRHAGVARRPGHRGDGGAGGGTAAWPRRSRPGTSAARRWRRPSASSAWSAAAWPSSPPTSSCWRRPRWARSRNPMSPAAARPRPCRRSATRSPRNTSWPRRATVQALVPVMLGAMAQDHERATGPWQAEALASRRPSC